MTGLGTLIFDHAHPKKIHQLPVFVNLYQHAKIQSSPTVHSSDTVNFRIQSPYWPHLFLAMLTPKIFNYLLICMNLYQHAKNHFAQSIKKSHLFIIELQSILASRDQTGDTHFLIMLDHKSFEQLLIFVNLY